MKASVSYVLYGMPAFGLSIVGIPLYIYLPTFYTSDLSLAVGSVGMILVCARLIDMLLDPLIGHWSDTLVLPGGKRKPWMLLGTVLIIGGYYALIHPPTSGLYLWLLGFSLITYAGWSFISVPYMALSSEISLAYHAKTWIASSREIMTMLGMITALAIPSLLGVADVPFSTLHILFTLLLISLPLGIALLIWGVPSLPPQSALTPKLRDLLSLLTTKNVKVLLSAYFTNALANAIPSTLFLYFVSLILHDASRSGPLLVLYIASGVLGLPLWLWISLRLGKKRAWMLSMAVCSLSFCAVPFLGDGDTLFFALIVFLSGLCLGADLTLSSSLQADLAQSYTHSALSGVLFGLWGMCTKLSLALGVGIAFGILGLLGFDANHPNEASLVALSLLYGLVPVLLKALSIAILFHLQEINEHKEGTNLSSFSL